MYRLLIVDDEELNLSLVMSFLKKTKLANIAVKAAGKELQILDTGKKPEEVLCVLNEAHSVVELEDGKGSTLRLVWIPGTRTDS